MTQNFPLTRKELNELVDELAFSAAFSEERLKGEFRGFLQYNVQRPLLKALGYIDHLPNPAMLEASREIFTVLENIKKEIEPGESR
tara:strand:+ start:717 stop:974 length:258 start_codon:yes stop_codon:yes gene_type:complete